MAAARALVEQLEKQRRSLRRSDEVSFPEVLLRRSLNPTLPQLRKHCSHGSLRSPQICRFSMAQHLNSNSPGALRFVHPPDLMSYLKERVEASDIGENAAEPAHHHPELKSVRRFRESLRRRQSEKAVTHGGR